MNARRRISMAAAALAATTAVAGVTGGASSLGQSARAAHAAPQKPNIVFVLTDDLAWNLVRYMPHVKRLQHKGTTFTRYEVTDSLCCPSRASIFTGRFPHDTGVFTNGGSDGGFQLFHDTGQESSTFATDLQARGYRTAMLGKYLNGYQPDSGFVPPGWNRWVVAGNGYKEFDYKLNENGHVTTHGHGARDYLTDVLARKGAAFINRSARNHKSFMMEVATFAPHSPYTPAPRDADKFPGLVAPKGPAFNKANTNPPSWLAGRPPLTPRQIRKINRSFRKRAQAVQAVDDMIGRFRRRLRAHGIARKTYIVFSSDNGYHMGEHRLMPGKQTAFDSDIRVPLVVAGPGVPSKRTVGRIAENIDLRPTFDSLAGASFPANVDGHNLGRVLHGRHVASWRKAALIEHHGPDVDKSDPDFQTKVKANPSTYEAIRLAHSVYVEYLNGEREYYNLRKDRPERHNTVASLSNERRNSLHTRLTALANCHNGSSCWAAGGG